MASRTSRGSSQRRASRLPTARCCRSTSASHSDAIGLRRRVAGPQQRLQPASATTLPKSCRSPRVKASSAGRARSRARAWQTAALAIPSIQARRRSSASGPAARTWEARPAARRSRVACWAPMRVSAWVRSSAGVRAPVERRAGAAQDVGGQRRVGADQRGHLGHAEAAPGHELLDPGHHHRVGRHQELAGGDALLEDPLQERQRPRAPRALPRSAALRDVLAHGPSTRGGWRRDRPGGGARPVPVGRGRIRQVSRVRPAGPEDPGAGGPRSLRTDRRRGAGRGPCPAPPSKTKGGPALADPPRGSFVASL